MPGRPGSSAAQWLQKPKKPSLVGLTAVSSQHVTAHGNAKVSATLLAMVLSKGRLAVAHALEARRVDRIGREIQLHGNLEGGEPLGAKLPHAHLERLRGFGPREPH